jgi:hypothetical protein
MVPIGKRRRRRRRMVKAVIDKVAKIHQIQLALGKNFKLNKN